LRFCFHLVPAKIGRNKKKAQDGADGTAAATAAITEPAAESAPGAGAAAAAAAAPPVSRRASSGRRRDVAHIAAPPPPPPKPKALALLVVHEPALPGAEDTLTGDFNPLALAEPIPQSSPTASEPISDAGSGSEDWEVVSPKAIDSHRDRWTDVPA
jgi:hypothetical protein